MTPSAENKNTTTERPKKKIIEKNARLFNILHVYSFILLSVFHMFWVMVIYVIGLHLGRCDFVWPISVAPFTSSISILHRKHHHTQHTYLFTPLHSPLITVLYYDRHLFYQSRVIVVAFLTLLFVHLERNFASLLTSSPPRPIWTMSFSTYFFFHSAIRRVYHRLSSISIHPKSIFHFKCIC